MSPPPAAAICRTILASIAVSVLIAPSPGAARSFARDVLVLDAVANKTAAAGPDANHAGHQQIASGTLRNSAGRRVGDFAYRCRWIAILGNGDARERCAGSGQTRDGRLEFGGLTRASLTTNAFALTGGTSAYRGAHGTLAARTLSERESLITITITPRTGVTLGVALVPRPAANTGFLDRANHLCQRAASELAALPAFPFAGFDPLQPDATVLPKVGAFFTGPGDPRPILRSLYVRLRALGQPPASRGAWKQALGARAAALRLTNRQDHAALAGDVVAFVKTVHASDRVLPRLAITATVFGATQCVQ